jgi:hypothetical protein
MSADPESRIPLEAFHRHFLVTHLKGKAACLLDQLERKAKRSGDSFSSLLAELVASCYPQSGFQDDKWYAREVRVNSCYFAHTDFRGLPVPKDSRFVDFMANQRHEIESGLFPCSSEVRALLSGETPEPLVQERGPAKYYVLDGQLRVIRHWYHNVPNVKVFIYRGNLDV